MAIGPSAVKETAIKRANQCGYGWLMRQFHSHHADTSWCVHLASPSSDWPCGSTPEGRTNDITFCGFRLPLGAPPQGNKAAWMIPLSCPHKPQAIRSHLLGTAWGGLRKGPCKMSKSTPAIARQGEAEARTHRLEEHAIPHL